MSSDRLRAQLLLVIFGVFAMVGPARNVSAALIAYEGYDYADTTNIVGTTGGVGWGTAWTRSGNANAQNLATTPGLSYDGLSVSGNKATLTAQQNNAGSSGNSVFDFRTISAPQGADGSTVWLSFLGQRTGDKTGAHGAGGAASYQRIFALAFFNGGTSTSNERFSIGELSSSTAAVDTDTWGLNIFGTPNVTIPTTTPIDQQSLLLARIDYGTGPLSDNAYLWVNPDLSLGEPSLASANASLLGRNLEFDRVRMSAGGSQSTGAVAAASGLMDEIRIGMTFGDVIPEPGSLTLVLLSVASGCLFKLRR